MCAYRNPLRLKSGRQIGSQCSSSRTELEAPTALSTRRVSSAERLVWRGASACTIRRGAGVGGGGGGGGG